MRRRGERTKKRWGGLTGKALMVLLPVVIIAVGLIVWILYSSTSRIISEKSTNLLETSTENVLHQVEAWTNETLTALNTERDALEFFAEDDKSQLRYIKHTAGQYDAFPAGIYLGTSEGRVIHDSFVPGDDYDMFEKSWYKDGLKSEEMALGEIYFDEDSQSYVVGASGVFKGKDGEVKGAAAADLYLTDISELVKEVTLQKTGGMMLIDYSTQMIIGHKEDDAVGKTLDEMDGKMYSVIKEKVSSGKEGVTAFEDDAKETVTLDIQNVPNTNWGIVSYVPKAEVMQDLNEVSRNSVIIAVLFIILLSAVIAVLLIKVIVKPIKQIDRVASDIADGKLDAKITYRSNDELGALSNNFNQTVEKLQNYVDYIDEISKVLNEIAGGNLRFKLSYEYLGEFHKIKEAIMNISNYLAQTVRQIDMTAREVTDGSGQMSASAQALAQGSSEQASSIEELAAVINESAVRMKKSAEMAQAASTTSEKTANDITESQR